MRKMLYMRRYLLLSATAAVLVAASFAPIATATRGDTSPAVVNGGFASGLDGWTAVGETSPCPWTAIVALTGEAVCHAGYGFAEPAPVEGDSFASTDFDRSDASAPTVAKLFQRLTVPNRGGVTLRWSDFLSWDLVTYGALQPRTVTVEIRDPAGVRILRTLATKTIQPGTANFGMTGWIAHNADITRFAGCEVTLMFSLTMPEVATGPATYSVDNVRIDSVGGFRAAPAPSGRCG
jgi:hypothetical protein